MDNTERTPTELATGYFCRCHELGKLLNLSVEDERVIRLCDALETKTEPLKLTRRKE